MKVKLGERPRVGTVGPACVRPDKVGADMSEQPPLVLVSNRGPVTYQEDGSVKRGTGGLVTALTGLASHRDAIWIASAMTDQDVEVAREHGGKPFEVEAPEGGSFRVRFVESDAEAYDRFYNIIANPMLWFIQHYLWDLSNAPDIRRHEVEAFKQGYQVVNRDLADAVIDEIEGQEEPVVMVHDYHLYTLPGMVREARPDVFLHHFIHIPWTQPDAWRVLPTAMREEIYNGLLANDIIGFHTRSYQRNFLQCCRDLMDLEVDFERGRRPHATAARCGCATIRCRSTTRPRAASPAAPRVREFEERVLARRREFAILRVDRADLSKNVLRGFTAFDIFLEQHPEFAERITFTAQLMPSRTDVPEYAEYLEKIEALVAVVNHRHGTPDWMPIDLKLRDDLDEAVASYKHYDVMMVNAMFDGMNLVAKEGPLVNERHGVSILCENTGAHEELGEFAISVNPFDVQELADAIYAALMMSPGGPRAPRPRAQGDRHLARPGRLDRRADRRHPRQEHAPRARPSSAASKPNSPRAGAPGRRGAAPAAPVVGASVVAPARPSRDAARSRRLARRRGSRRAPSAPRHGSPRPRAGTTRPRRRRARSRRRRASPAGRARRRGRALRSPRRRRRARRRLRVPRRDAPRSRRSRLRSAAARSRWPSARPGRRAATAPERRCLRESAARGRRAGRRGAVGRARPRRRTSTRHAIAPPPGDVAPADARGDVVPHALVGLRRRHIRPTLLPSAAEMASGTPHLRPHPPARPGRRGRAS